MKGYVRVVVATVSCVEQFLQPRTIEIKTDNRGFKAKNSSKHSHVFLNTCNRW